MNKKLIIYFSYSNNTRTIAKKIQKQLNCDILEIKTVIPYSTDYQTVVDDEHNRKVSNFLPEIEPIDVNLNQYDTLILGTPVWWYRPTPAIRTFLTQNDLSNKTIIPFATNAGWLGKTFIEIKKICSNSKIEKEMNIVFDVNARSKLITNEEAIKEWINSL